MERVWQCAALPDVAALITQVADLQQLLTGVTREDGGATLRITGANLQVVSGTGTTTGTVNGLGNVIIGYNEPRETDNNRTGSHMLVVGSRNNYSAFGGIVVGFEHTTSGDYASVSGGAYGIASGHISSVSGGINNIASGQASSVSGGQMNNASGVASSVSGGALNTASGLESAISGGFSLSTPNQYDWAAGTLVSP